MDSAGILHLIYFSGAPAGGDLYYVRSRDYGATFSTPVRVNSQPGSAIATGTIRGGQLALGRGGRVHVVWNGSDTARPRGAINPDNGKPGAPFLYARSSPDGHRFERQRNLSGGVYSVDGGGTVAADDNGHVYAVWHGNRETEGRGEDHRAVWIARSADDGASFAPEGLAWPAQTGACGCCQARALATGPRGLTILYRSATNLTHRDIYVLTSRDGGASFAGSIVQPWEINACPMTSLSLATAGSRIVAAWETAGQVFLGSVDADAGRMRGIVPAPGPVSRPQASTARGLRGRRHAHGLDREDRVGARRLRRMASLRRLRAEGAHGLRAGARRLELRHGSRPPRRRLRRPLLTRSRRYWMNLFPGSPTTPV